MGGNLQDCTTRGAVSRYQRLVDLAQPYGLVPAIENFVSMKFRRVVHALTPAEVDEVILTFTPLIVDIADQKRNLDRLQ